MSETKLPAKFIKKIQGKDFVLFEGLLEMAHAAGLKRVATELVQAPHADNGNLAIVRAEVETDKGVFAALGDASPESTEKPMQPHLVRLADTRAIARAMRLAVNVGMTAAEEVGAGEPFDGGSRNRVTDSNKDSLTPDEREKSGWLEKPEEVVLSFGKHADKRLGDVLIEDPTYVDWLAKEAYDYVLRTAAKKLLESSAPKVSEDLSADNEIVF